MNIFKKIKSWFVKEKEPEAIRPLPMPITTPIDLLPPPVDEVVKDKIVTKQKQKRISKRVKKIYQDRLDRTPPRSMTDYERQVYYGMGYKQFEKYKRSLWKNKNPTAVPL